MKKPLFAFALLLSSYIIADVDLSIMVQKDDYKSEESCTLSSAQPTYSYTSCCGAQLNITLQNEGENEVELAVECTKSEQVHFNSTLKIAYGDQASLACESEKVDAQIIIKATKSEQ